MKRILYLLFAMLSQTIVLHAQLGRYKADFSVSACEFTDSVDIEWVDDQVYVPVRVMGRTLRFLLDTGASQAVVFHNSWLAEGPSVGSIISHDATGRADTVQMVMLPPLQLGSVMLTGCRATVHQHATPGIDGILGFDLVNGGLSLLIDVKRQKLFISNCRNFLHSSLASDGRTVNPCRSEGVRYWLNYHVPYVMAVPFGHTRLRALIDTGSRHFFAMNKSSFDRVVGDSKSVPYLTIEGRSYGSHITGHYGVEAAGEVVFLQHGRFLFGHTSFCDLHSVSTQGGTHVGAPILNYGRLAFCARHRRMLFMPYSEEQPISVGNRQLEIAFVAYRGMPQVGLVWEQGVPFRQGFRQGDIIEQIDHLPVTSLRQFRRWPFERGREYLFTVADSLGRKREVRWVRLP